MSDITQLLHKASGNKDPKVQEKFLSAVYNELRLIARAKMANERPGQTIQPTILAHDAWLKLFPEGSSPTFKNKAHFFGAVARVMRNILVDRARSRLAIKRGGDQHKTSLDTEKFEQLAYKASDELIEAVDGVLNEISGSDAKTFAVIQMKFFLEMKMDDVAEKLGVSVETAGKIYRDFKRKYKSRFQDLV